MVYLQRDEKLVSETIWLNFNRRQLFRRCWGGTRQYAVSNRE